MLGRDSVAKPGEGSQIRILDREVKVQSAARAHSVRDIDQKAIVLVARVDIREKPFEPLIWAEYGIAAPVTVDALLADANAKAGEISRRQDRFSVSEATAIERNGRSPERRMIVYTSTEREFRQCFRISPKHVFLADADVLSEI
ncbi:hypothetical protein SAMN05444149_1033 [Pseudosulfitobacter pseudonitzschiae]|nr:hypothetical protein SAMN05444149_1033 [Pseudosulfitobacter pseudonitzschiae]